MDNHARFQVNKPSIVNDVIDGEVVMINLDTGSYYSADAAGATIWEALAVGTSFTGIVDFVQSRFEGRREEIEAAVRRFLDRLLDEKLVVPAAASPSNPALPSATVTKKPFSEPKLDRYDDMKDLLLADPIHDVGESGWPPRPAPPTPNA